ncbi:hypothetical protein ABPG72_015777 [Tetrahymena utriculariae]
MNFQNLDLFSQQFYFNIKNSQIRKGTLFGSLLSISIIGLTLYYLIYLLNQYINNQIAPNYKMQNLTNDGSIDLKLSEDLVAFRFESDYNQSVDILEKKTNQTYIVYLAYFIYFQESNYQFLPLDVIKCSTSNLLGYYCLDYSKISNYTLVSNQKNSIQSQIQLNIYGCQELDIYKTKIPDNCASQDDINNLINGLFASLKIRVKTSQYNTTSQQIETSYRSSLIYGLSNLQILTTVKILEQITKVKQGLFTQSSSSFSSPVQYSIQTQSFDKKSAFLLTDVDEYLQVNILVDEMFQSLEIQYPSLPQVFSFVNSLFSMLMLVGFIARKFSLSTIKRDFIMLFLQNYYQGIYLQISKDIKLVQQNDQLNQQPQQMIIVHHQHFQNQSEEECDENQIQDEIENQQERFKNHLPSIPFKQKQVLDQKCKTPKIELLKAEDQSNSIFDQQTLNNQYYTQLRQKQLQSTKSNETTFYQRESFENSKNQSNQKIFNQLPIKLKKLSENQDLSSPQKQMLASINNSQFLNTNQKDKKQNHLIQNTSSTPIVLDERNIRNQETKDFSKTMQKLQVSKNTNISTKIDKFLFGCRCWRRKKITQNFNSKQLQKLETQVNKELDIFRIYKDIVFLKKAMYILLSHDQLAALQLMGCSYNFLDQDLNELTDSINTKNLDLNYYEQQLAISLSDDLQCQFSKQFLEKCQSNKLNLNKIDLRILQSIQKDFID